MLLRLANYGEPGWEGMHEPEGTMAQFMGNGMVGFTAAALVGNDKAILMYGL